MIVHEQKVPGGKRYRIEFESKSEWLHVTIDKDFDDFFRQFPIADLYSKTSYDLARDVYHYHLKPVAPFVRLKEWWWFHVSLPILGRLLAIGVLRHEEGTVLPWHWPFTRLQWPRGKKKKPDMP